MRHEIEQRPIGCIAADRLSVRPLGTRSAGAEQLDQLIPLGIHPPQLACTAVCGPVRRKAGIYAHAPLRKRSGLIREQNGQAARSFDAGQPPHKHMILDHPEHIAREHDGNHHGQPLGHGDHHDRDRQCRRVQQVGGNRLCADNQSIRETMA